MGWLKKDQVKVKEKPKRIREEPEEEIVEEEDESEIYDDEEEEEEAPRNRSKKKTPGVSVSQLQDALINHENRLKLIEASLFRIRGSI